MNWRFWRKVEPEAAHTDPRLDEFNSLVRLAYMKTVLWQRPPKCPRCGRERVLLVLIKHPAHCEECVDEVPELKAAREPIELLIEQEQAFLEASRIVRGMER